MGRMYITTSDAGGAAAGSSAAAGGVAAATTSMSATLESTGWRLLRLPKLSARRTVAAITSTLASQDSCSNLLQSK